MIGLSLILCYLCSLGRPLENFVLQFLMGDFFYLEKLELDFWLEITVVLFVEFDYVPWPIRVPPRFSEIYLLEDWTDFFLDPPA